MSHFIVGISPESYLYNSCYHVTRLYDDYVYDYVYDYDYHNYKYIMTMIRKHQTVMEESSRLMRWIPFYIFEIIE